MCCRSGITVTATVVDKFLVAVVLVLALAGEVVVVVATEVVVVVVVAAAEAAAVFSLFDTNIGCQAEKSKRLP